MTQQQENSMHSMSKQHSNAESQIIFTFGHIKFDLRKIKGQCQKRQFKAGLSTKYNKKFMSRYNIKHKLPSLPLPQLQLQMLELYQYKLVTRTYQTEFDIRKSYFKLFTEDKQKLQSLIQSKGKCQFFNIRDFIKIKFPSLKQLNISGLVILSLQSLSWIDLSNLQKINLSDNRIRNTKSLGKCQYRQLEQLVIGNNPIVEIDYLARANFPKLKRIQKEDNEKRQNSNSQEENINQKNLSKTLQQRNFFNFYQKHDFLLKMKNRSNISREIFMIKEKSLAIKSKSKCLLYHSILKQTQIQLPLAQQQLQQNAIQYMQVPNEQPQSQDQPSNHPDTENSQQVESPLDDRINDQDQDLQNLLSQQDQNETKNIINDTPESNQNKEITPFEKGQYDNDYLPGLYAIIPFNNVIAQKQSNQLKQMQKQVIEQKYDYSSYQNSYIIYIYEQYNDLYDFEKQYNLLDQKQDLDQFKRQFQCDSIL